MLLDKDKVLGFVKNIDFKPKLFETIKNYDKQTFTSDLMAGIIVGVVALPLAIAFAIASNPDPERAIITPEQGIITAVIAGFIIAFFGGSKVQIGGPTAAFIFLVAGIVKDYGATGLIVATLLSGVILLLLGVFKLGTIIKFIPYPIIVGFTSGIAVTIFTTQIPDLCGLDFGGETVATSFVGKWMMYFRYMFTIKPMVLFVGLGSVSLIVYSPKWAKQLYDYSIQKAKHKQGKTEKFYTTVANISNVLKKIPGSFVAILVITLVAIALKSWGVEGLDTIGDRFKISSTLPAAEVPDITWDNVKNLMSAALAIAMLGAIESLLSATVADGVINDKHNSNTELIAQGIANIVTPIFGGIPATGAIARTMTNINNGGKTPIAGIIHAVVLLFILLFLMPLAEYIPMACLAGVLLVVAYNMSEWRTFKSMLKNPKGDVAVLLITFSLTVIFDLTVAIQVGVVIACIFFMKRVAETTDISIITGEGSEDTTQYDGEPQLVVPEGVEVYEINGPYFFGIANKFEEYMSHMYSGTYVRIIRMRKVPFVDSTGINNLTNLCKKSIKAGVEVVFSGVRPNVRYDLERMGFDSLIGKENICPNITSALYRAEEIVQRLQEIEKKEEEENS